MIRGAKDMIAGCRERFRRGDCGTCERRAACAFLARDWQRPAKVRQSGPRPDGRLRASARPFLAALLRGMAKAMESRRDPPRGRFRREVERRMQALLESGEVGIDRIARELGCSRQTLYRRLKAEGVTFGQLLDGLRRRLALRFVREPGLSVKEMGYRLGFSDPAAFSRAFKRWTGSSPRAMQREGASSTGVRPAQVQRSPARLAYRAST